MHTFTDETDDERLTWNVERLWKLAANLPRQPVPVSDLISIFDHICWASSNPKPGVWEDILHAKRIMETDLKYPVILSASGSLMDGAHRIAKAWILGLETIDVVKFDEDPAPDIRVPKRSTSTED